MKQYYNNKGVLVVVSEMPDGYLLNSLAKYKARLKVLIERKGKPGYQIAGGYIREVTDFVNSLSVEVKKRGII
jgi:hypothetical protein